MSLNCEGYPRHYGNRFFFGRKGFWDVIVVDETYECLWKKLFTHADFQDFEKLRKDFLNKLSPSEWRYYFVKYNEIFDELSVEGMSYIKDKNIFLMPYGKESILSICVEKLLKDRANSYHVNPFIYLICKKKKVPTSWADEGQNKSGIRWGYGVRDSEEFYSYIVKDGKKYQFMSCKVCEKTS